MQGCSSRVALQLRFEMAPFISFSELYIVHQLVVSAVENHREE